MLKIILIGPSGVGKTLIGNKLSEKLKLKFIDQDEYLHSNLSFTRKVNYSSKEFLLKKKFELEIFEKFVINSNEDLIFASSEGFIINFDLDKLVKIQNYFRLQKNVIFLFPFEDIDKSVEILKKRWQVKEISLKQKELFKKYYILFTKISSKVIYTKDYPLDDILEKIIFNLDKK